MDLSLTNLDQLLNLAKLTLPDSEKPLYLNQLQNILDYIDTLNQLNIHHLEPTFFLNTTETPFRSDEPCEQPINLELNAPEIDDTSFVVPQILSD